MRSWNLIAAALLFPGLAMMAGRAEADIYWSSIATACTPDSAAIQNDRYVVAPDSTVSPKAGMLDPIVLICPVPVKGPLSPDVLSMTYLDSTGTAPAAAVQAQFIRVNRATGARGIIATVSSNSFAEITLNKHQSAPFSGTLDPAAFYYYVRIVLDRAATNQTVHSLGVALEERPIASFGPALSYARVGTTNAAPTFPQPLTVTLKHPAADDTTITVVSGNPAALSAANVVIPSGATSAALPVTAHAQNADVTVTATLRSQSSNAHVRVLGATEDPTAVTLSPANVSIAPGGSVQFTVSLDVPSRTSDSVSLAVNPANAGTLPPSVTVPADQKSATFTYTDAAVANSATITATFGASNSPATVTVN